MKITLLLAVIALLGACKTTNPQSVQHYMVSRGLDHTTLEKPDNLLTCRGYGCRFVEEVELHDSDWKAIKKLFKPKSKSAEQEREHIKKAIALMEQYVGEANGTGGDIAKTFKKTGDFQHDCVDESTNTTSYLLALAQKDLIHFHDIQPPTMRFPFVNSGGWPHQTAVIKERETGAIFAVDSWFYDNGKAPEIVPLEDWLDGWSPEKAKQKTEKAKKEDVVEHAEKET